jgi:hypothetical protein
MTTFEKKIESVQEYNLLKLLKANSSLKRFGVEWIKLDHNLCRAFATNEFAMIVADLEPNQWHDIFDELPDFVFIDKLKRNEVHYIDGVKFDRVKYSTVFEAVGQEPNYQPVMHLDLELLRNLTDKFDDVYFVKQSGLALFMKLEGDKYPAGSYYGALMPKSITQVETAKIIDALSSLATDGEIRRQWVADLREFAQGGDA